MNISLLFLVTIILRFTAGMTLKQTQNVGLVRIKYVRLIEEMFSDAFTSYDVGMGQVARLIRGAVILLENG